jgi:hypothetical protein
MSQCDIRVRLLFLARQFSQHRPRRRLWKGLRHPVVRETVASPLRPVPRQPASVACLRGRYESISFHGYTACKLTSV